MSDYDDSHLWAEMAAATTEEERHSVAARVVEFHRGFLRYYTNSTALLSWDQATREDYEQECALVAQERALQYDPRYVGDNGKATFCSYLRRYLQPVRWRVDGRSGTVTVGVETRRLQVGAAAIRASRGSATIDEIADELSKVHGKRISRSRTRSLLAPRQMLRLDAGLGVHGCPDGSGALLRDTVALPGDPDPADEVVAQLERQAASELVRDLLQQLSLTQVERVVLVERLMAPPRLLDPSTGETIHPGPATLRSIGERFGVSDEAIRKAEKRLLERMRAVLDPDAA